MEELPESLEGFSYRELQVLAKSRSVKANGKKEELIRRLVKVSTARVIFSATSTSHDKTNLDGMLRAKDSLQASRVDVARGFDAKPTAKVVPIVCPLPMRHLEALSFR